MISRFLAVFTAFAMLVGGFSAPAFADRGKPAERVWMSGQSLADITSELRLGSEVCVGSKKNHACSRINPFTGEALIMDVSRPVGANKNVVVNTIVATTPEGVVLRNEAGVVLARFQVGSENANWQATLQSAFPAAIGGITNGLGASVVQALACCGNTAAPTAIAISDSAAQSIANTLIQGVGGVGSCGSGSCPVARNDN